MCIEYSCYPIGLSAEGRIQVQPVDQPRSYNAVFLNYFILNYAYLWDLTQVSNSP